MSAEQFRRVVGEVKPYAMSSLHKSFVKLLEADISDMRMKNDTATEADVLRNQGAIRELKRILKAIQPTTKVREFDGAYMD